MGAYLEVKGIAQTEIRKIKERGEENMSEVKKRYLVFFNMLNLEPTEKLVIMQNAIGVELARRTSVKEYEAKQVKFFEIFDSWAKGEKKP